MAAPRRQALALSMTLAGLLLAGAACGTISSGSPGAPAAAPSASGAEGLGAGPSPTADAKPAPTAAPTPTKPAATPYPYGYPGASLPYAEGVLAAWAQKLAARLGDLTTPMVQEQLLEVPGPVNQQWTYQQCDGAAGSSYCSFVNADGDVITLRVVNQKLGQAHAATEVKLDRTVLSNDAKEYVRSFVEAWRNGNVKRMVALSSQGQVDYFTHFPPPSTYTVCKREVGPVWQVRIHNPSGLNYLVMVTTASLGQKHAIASHVDPVPLPPVCA